MRNEKLFEKASLEGQVYGKLFALTNLIQTRGDDFFSDITLKQHFVLLAISIFEDYSPALNEVAEIAGSSYQNIKKISTLLEKKGYLSIMQDTEDKRKFRLVLTDKIRKVSADMDKEIKRFFDNLFKGLSKEQKKSMLLGLKQMEQNVANFKR